MTMQYFEDRFAGWIVNQGGWVSCGRTGAWILIFVSWFTSLPLLQSKYFLKDLQSGNKKVCVWLSFILLWVWNAGKTDPWQINRSCFLTSGIRCGGYKHWTGFWARLVSQSWLPTTDVSTWAAWEHQLLVLIAGLFQEMVQWQTLAVDSSNLDE